MTSTISPQHLTESRIQLHYAIQYIAATGAALATPKPDGSQASLSWQPDLNLFVGDLIPAPHPFRVALDPIALSVLILDDQGMAIAQCPLHQKTLMQGLEWLKTEVAKRGAEAEKIQFLSYPPNDFPVHDLAQGMPFDPRDVASRHQLINAYAQTDVILRSLDYKLPVLIWPHHFDIAMLIQLNDTQSIGVGFSPGDTSYDEPYWYVSPYPYPDPSQLPAIESTGFWHTSHWVGGVLLASALSSDREAAMMQIQQFITATIQASEGLLSP
ncbi:MAG: hypothetical protein MUF49_31230 [Oculatellaceae cyanobacterium Prado106]|jgi:hypothetical protein|nr:hypothetical protein [Oculatellaceae cyanobacterium Prado106]